MRVLGIDEAGRGCVLGPLVVAGFVAEGPPFDALVEAGADDSKRLSPKRRQAAREALTAVGTADVRTVSARAIDEGNLNALEEAVIIDLIRRWKPDHVILDALGHPKTLPKVVARIEAALADLDTLPTLQIEPKADRNHPPVGAASIFAKTTRDALLAEVAQTWGVLGSGYPSDPKTRAWLAAHAATGEDWPAFVRTRWGTVRALAQSDLFADGDAP